MLLTIGLLLFGAGEALLIAGGIGVSPWTVIAQGVGITVGIGIGSATLAVSLVVLLFWISRIWILVSRGEVDQDPVLFAVKDKMSYMLGLLTGLFVYLSTYI